MFACNQTLMISLRGTQIRYLENIVGAHCGVQQLLTSVELYEEENQNDPQLQLQREKDIR